MAFLTPLLLEDVQDGWVVHTPLVYEAHDGARYAVPPGFFTDLASVPRAFWWLFPRDGCYRKAAVLHDWLVTAPSILSWGQAADVFEAAMADIDVPWLRRKTIANAVRFWGLFK